MPSTVYVANLGHSVDRSELTRLFSAHGTVRSAELINQYNTVDGTRAGLIEMGSEQEAAAAIEGLHGAPLRGGALAVGWANGAPPPPPMPPPLFGPMNVPAHGEDPQSADPGRRDCRPMLP
jgi:RNA recognition motif-containing protein